MFFSSLLFFSCIFHFLFSFDAISVSLFTLYSFRSHFLSPPFYLLLCLSLIWLNIILFLLFHFLPSINFLSACSLSVPSVSPSLFSSFPTFPLSFCPFHCHSLSSSFSLPLALFLSHLFIILPLVLYSFHISPQLHYFLHFSVSFLSLAFYPLSSTSICPLFYFSIPWLSLPSLIPFPTCFIRPGTGIASSGVLGRGAWTRRQERC